MFLLLRSLLPRYQRVDGSRLHLTDMEVSSRCLNDKDLVFTERQSAEDEN